MLYSLLILSLPLLGFFLPISTELLAVVELAMENNNVISTSFQASECLELIPDLDIVHHVREATFIAKLMYEKKAHKLLLYNILLNVWKTNRRWSLKEKE